MEGAGTLIGPMKSNSPKRQQVSPQNNVTLGPPARVVIHHNSPKRERGTLALQVLFALLLTMQRLTADQEPGWQLLDGVPRWRFGLV